MKILNSLAKGADKALMTFTAAAILILLMFSGYSLYDNIYTNRNSFASYDLLKYKPTKEAAAGSQINGFDELLAVNGQAAAWLTVYDTHIDYPVVQGRDNYEYANKDVFGKASLTGAIYVSADNDRSFNDGYSIIYGHHMDNGGMFGDIEKYYDEEFFKEHTDAFLQTFEADYRLTIFAFVVTDAYDSQIYHNSYNSSEENRRLLKYIQSNALYISDSFKNADISQIDKLIALSTCEDAATNGRIVLFANAVVGEGRPEEAKAPDILTAIGHVSNSESCAFLNLVCAVLNVFTLFPVLWIRTKYRQIPYAARMSKALKDSDRAVSRDMGRFARAAIVGLILELILTALSIIFFIKTENITKPMIIRDDKTIVMIIILVLTYIIDFICFRYRGKRPQAQSEKEGGG